MRNLIILLFFTTTFSSYSQSQVDSLWNIYQSDDIDDSIRYEALSQRIRVEPSLDSNIKYLKVLKEQTASLVSPYWQTVILLQKAEVCLWQNKIDSSLYFSHLSINPAQKTGRNLLIAKSYYALGYTYYQKTSKYDTAKFYLEKAIELRELEKRTNTLDDNNHIRLLHNYLQLAGLHLYYTKNFYRSNWIT